MKLFDIKYSKVFPFISMSKDTFFGILFEMLVLGVFGFILESICDYIFVGAFIDRGFLCGPFIPVYAIVAFIVCMINYFPKPTKKSILYVSFTIFVFSIIFEEIVGRFSESVFNAVLWTYQIPLTSPSGYTNLFVSIGWAVGGSLYIFFVVPYLFKLSKKISTKIKLTLHIETGILVLIDFIYTLYRNHANGKYIRLYELPNEPSVTLFIIGILIYVGLVSYILYAVSMEIRKLSKKLDIFLFLISSIILLAPFFAAYEYLERSGIGFVSALASFGFLDAAFLIYFALSLIATAILVIIYKFIIQGFEKKKELKKGFYFYKNPKFKAFFLLANIGLSIFVIILGIISLKNPKTTRLEIGSGDNELKIVTVSDIHYSTIGNITKLDDLVYDLNQYDADIIFFLGDTVDNYMRNVTLGKKRRNYVDVEVFADYMRQIHSTYGIYNINGNHEFETNGIADVRYFFSTVELLAPNFHYLDNEATTIAGVLNVVGRRDYKIGGSTKSRMSIDSILSSSGLDKSLDLIVLDHQPQDFKEAKESGAILQLSGHTHNGQIFPGNIIVSMLHKIKYNCISNGLYQEDDFSLYISRGYGAWGFPMRTTGNSEIVEIRYKF